MLLFSGGATDARHIVDGHREKTLTLLWQMIFHFQVSFSRKNVRFLSCAADVPLVPLMLLQMIPFFIPSSDCHRSKIPAPHPRNSSSSPDVSLMTFDTPVWGGHCESKGSCPGGSRLVHCTFHR